MPFGELEVYVEGALGIKDTGIFGKSSPYCVLTCGAQQFKTPIAQDAGSNPYWNKTFLFKIDRSCQQIGIKIYCHNTLSADDELAYTSLSFKKIFFEGHFVPLQSFNVLRPSGKVGGQIRMSLTFFSDTLKHQQSQRLNPESTYYGTVSEPRTSATYYGTVSEPCTSEYTPNASLRPGGGRAAAARPDYRSDRGYSSPGSIQSRTAGNQVQFHPNQQQMSLEDPQGARQSYDNYYLPPNIQAKAQFDLGVQAASSHYTVDQNTIPGRSPRHHFDPASRPIIPQPTSHRSADHYANTIAAEITKHTGHQHGNGHPDPANSTKSPQPTGSRSEEHYDDPVLSGMPRSTPLNHCPQQEQYAATALNSVARPLTIFSGHDRDQLADLPRLQVHAAPAHQQAPVAELRSGLAPPVVQTKSQPGSLPVGMQPKVPPDQNVSSSREMDNDGPLYQPRWFANRQQPQPPPDPKSKDYGSHSDNSTKSKKSESSPKSAILDKSQKAESISRLKQVQDQAYPQGGLPKIQYPVAIQQKVALDVVTSGSREMDNKGPVYHPGWFANRHQQQPLPDLKSQEPGSDSEKFAHSNKSKSFDKAAQLDSRRSQASAAPNVANEIQQADGAPTIQPEKKLTETLAATLVAPTHQSPKLRASSFQSGKSSELPTAPCEEPPVGNHPHVGPTGSDSDVKPNGSANSKESQILQASSAQGITSAELSSQHLVQECHSPVLQPLPGALGGQSNESNQSTSMSVHGHQSPHPPGLDGSYSDSNSDGSKNSKPSYTSAVSRRSKTSNASAHSNHSNLVLHSAPAKIPASNFGGSNLDRSVPLGCAGSTPNSDVSVHKSLSVSKEADDDSESGPEENLQSALPLHLSASEDGDLGIKTAVDKDPGASECEGFHVNDEIGQFDQGGDDAGCSESGDAYTRGGTGEVQQGVDGEQDETTGIANNNYHFNKFDSKEYEPEEIDLNQHNKGESEKSRIYKQEEDVENDDHKVEDEDCDNYRNEQKTHAEEQNDYYENYDHEEDTHAEEQEYEEAYKGYPYASGVVPVEGHFGVIGNYSPHKQDHVKYANYEHEHDNSAEEQEQEKYEDESNGYAYTSEVVVPIEVDSRDFEAHPTCGVSSRTKMRPAQNHYVQLDSSSGQSTGFHGSSFTRVQGNSPQVSHQRMSRGQDQQFQSYSADNSPHYETQRSVPHQDFRNNKHQEHIFSKFEEVHRWLENSSTAGSPPDSTDRPEDLIPPTQEHIHQRQPPHNPHPRPRLQRPVTFHQPVTPDSLNRSEDLMPPTQDHIYQRQPPHNPRPRLQRPVTFHHPVTPDQVRQYSRQVQDRAQKMPSESFGESTVEKPPIIKRTTEEPKHYSGFNAIWKGALKLGKASLPFLGEATEAVVVQEVSGKPVIIGERNRHQGQYMHGGTKASLPSIGDVAEAVVVQEIAGK